MGWKGQSPAQKDPNASDWQPLPAFDPGHGHPAEAGLPVGLTGLPGATYATRFVGGTASGAPVSGTFELGDFVVDATGAVWVCTAAGSPGTWTEVAGGGGGAVSSVFGRTGAVVAGNADYLAVASGGLTGATAATRFVGATTSGAPATGTFAKGDFAIDQTGVLWICTTAGSPGTWTSISPDTAEVTSFNTRTGAVVLSKADVTGTGLAASDVGALPSTDDLSAIAAANATAANWSNNSKKITSLANGTAATDAAAFGQITAANAGAVALSTVTTAGDLIYATGNAAVARLGLGATGTVLQGGSSSPSWGVLPGTILATQQYAPASLKTYSFTSTTLTAVDTANATLSFTVPANGIVDVEVEANVQAASNTTTFGLGLLNHTGGAQIGDTIEVSTISSIMRQRVKFHLTGLTPGSLQVDLAAGSTGSTAHVYAMGHTGVVSASDTGPLIMQAVASV